MAGLVEMGLGVKDNFWSSIKKKNGKKLYYC